MSRAAGKVTLDAFALFNYRSEAAGTPVRAVIQHRSASPGVIEAQNRSVGGYVYSRARVHGAIVTYDAMAGAINAAVARGTADSREAFPRAPDTAGNAPTSIALDSSPAMSSESPSGNNPVLLAPSRDTGDALSGGECCETVGARPLQRLHDAYKHVSPTVVVTICNFVPVHVRVADMEA